MQPSYQLTKHPIGSIREMWTISWPLMLGLFSGCCMLFADRLLLARYSVEALNAATISGMASYILMIIPIMVVSFSEVFAGRNNGAGKKEEVGRPVWQMIWVSLLCSPIFWIGSVFLPDLFFGGSLNRILETDYFRWLIYFAPAFCTTVALSGFFTGIGRVRIVTYCAILGNVANIGLDILLIFGLWGFPEMGISGAALATGISQLIQTLFLMAIFLNRHNRLTYGTAKYAFVAADFIEGVRVGTPAGLGRFMETIAHYLFLRIVGLLGQDALTIVAMAQSFYILTWFLIEGLSKGVSTVSANLIGGQKIESINKVVRSGLMIQLFIAAFLLIGSVTFSETLVEAFLSESMESVAQNPILLTSAKWGLCWMCVYFLFDGIAWVLVGALSAGGDTKFMLYASFALNWVFYVLPAYFLFTMTQGTVDLGLQVMVFYSFLTAGAYWWRYRSGKWLHLEAKQEIIAPI